MARLALLLLVACLAAPLRAASISEPAADLEKKIPAILPEDVKKPAAVGPSSDLSDLSDLSEPVEEINNALRVKPAADIPVAVVVEDQPPVKLKEAEDEDVQRPLPDLRHPGPPQRQEHETQNPERHSDEHLKVSTIKENIEQAQVLLRDSFRDVTSDIQNWDSNNDVQDKIQRNIQNLRDTFTAQIKKLNDTIQALAKPEASDPVEKPEEPQRDFKKIESGLKVLEDNFNDGVETLAFGVDVVASLKSTKEGEEAREDVPAAPEAPAAPASPETPAPPASASTPAPNSPQYYLVQAMTALYNRTVQNFDNIQSFWTATTAAPTPAGAQADQPEGSTAAPSPWGQGFPAFSLPNFNIPFRPNANSNSSNTFGQIFSNNLGQYFTPNVSTLQLPPYLANIFNRPESTSAKPAEVAAALPDPATPVKPDEPKPAEAPATASQPPQPEGPIRQFLANNPVAQSISGAVQRLQNAIINPETPREPVEKSDNVDSKGGWYGPKPQSYGDNNDVSGGVIKQAAEEIKEPTKEEPKKEENKIEEVKPEVPEKTE